MRAGTIAIAALALALVSGCATPPDPFRGSVIEDPEPAADFTLTDQDGQPFRLGEQRGRVVILFFGYVHCPDVCPVTLSTWNKVRTALADESDRVEFVFVTVDPERDTAERLRRHMAVYGTDFVGLTGSNEELEPVYRDYGIHHQKVQFKESRAGYLVDHSTRMLVVDAEGRLRLLFGFDSPADDIVHDVRRLLSSG